MAEDYVLQTKITADSTQFDATLKKTGKSLTAFSSEITNVTKLVGGLFAITSLTALAKSISDVSKEFSKATSNIAKGTGATGKALDDLSKSVNKAMLNGVGRSASEVGSMVADLNTRFDVTGETLERMVDSFDDFASVTDTDVKTSINTVADIMAKWNISIEDSDKLLDQLTVASQMSGASVTELGTSLAKGQSILSQFGMTLTESTALFASLKKNGVETSVALAGMRTALANFSKDGKNAKIAFEEVSEKIKNAKTQTEALSIATETFGTRSGAEMLKVLQSSVEGTGNFAEALRNAGGALEETDRASRTSKDALDDLKATIQATFFSGSGDTKLRDMIDGIAEAIRSFDFSAIKETFSNLGLFIKGAWEQFKQLFNNLSGSIDITTGNFEGFADMIYQYLDNSYRSIQNFVNMIDAIMKGDWSVAWEYAELIVLRTIKNLEDSINNAIKLMPNLFNSVIDGYNWVLEQQDKLFLEIFHLPEKYFKSAKLPKYEGKDLIDTKSIENAIEDVRKTIEDKTGKSADYSLKQLAKVEKQTKKTTKSIEADIGDLGSSTTEQIDKTDSAFDGFLKSWSKQYEDLAGNWTQTAVDMADTIGGAFKETFGTLGEELVEGGGSFEDYAAVAVDAISQVLQALAAQLAAIAATKAATYRYAEASIAAAGAAAALVASGVMSGIAKSMKKVREETKSTSEAISNFAKTIEELKEANTNLAGFADIVARSNDLIRTSMLDLADIVNKNEKALSLFKMTTSDFWRLVENTSTSADKLANMLNVLSMPIAGMNSDNYKDTVKAIEQYRNALKFLDDSLNDVRKSLDETNKSLEANAWAYRYIISNYTDVTAQETKSKLLQGFMEVLETVATIGADIGETMMDSISDGASKSDFMLQMKKMLRENMIKLTVYNSEFTESLSRISGDLSKAILQNSESQIQSAVTEIEKLYDTASEVAKRVDNVLSGMFAGYEEEADEAMDIFKDLQKAIQSFRDSLVNTGTEIADNLISGINEGLKEQELFDVIKNYIRENIVRASVYADYATELAEIGKSISAGIAGKSAEELENAKNKISKIYKEMTESMKSIDGMLNGIFGTSELEIENNISKLKEAINSFYDSVVDLGSDIADKLISGISDGLKEQELFEVLKKYIRDNIIKASVYANYASELEEIGRVISGGILAKSGSELEKAKNKISKIYREMTESMQAIDEMLGDIFGKSTVEAVTGTTKTVVDNLSKLENAINSFKESIADVGADIANNLINGLTNGLSQSDFLTNMKDWLRKMLLQAVVYTETMKNEIEAIGKAISAGISGGFTDTSLHEIRRDLSYIFEQANKSVGKIDEVLGGVFGYANGTNNATRGLHIVGEAGPELVNFRGGEQILNNRNTQKALASVDSGNTFNVVFNNTQDTTAYAMMSQLRQYNREMAINGVL